MGEPGSPIVVLQDHTMDVRQFYEQSLSQRGYQPDEAQLRAIERLQRASRVKNSNMFAREQKQEYDPTSIPVVERPLAKQLQGTVKFQVPGGQATPAPPVGTALGRFGINLGQFVQQFNDKTKDAGGMPIPVVVNVYNDRSFDFVTKSPPAAALLKKAANIFH